MRNDSTLHNSNSIINDKINTSGISMVRRNVDRSVCSSWSRTPPEVQIEYLKQELDEKRREIKHLTRTVSELKAKLYDGISNISYKSENSVLSIPDLRVTALENENSELKGKNSELKKHNQWLMSR